MNTIGLLGTIHTEELRSRLGYPLSLMEKAIKQFNPDIICGEVRPEDYERYKRNQDDNGYLGPSEYRSMILPLCQKEDIEFIPVDWFEQEMRDLDHFAFQANAHQLKENLKVKYQVIFSHTHAGPLPLNHPVIDQLFKEKHDWLEKINPEVQNLVWTCRNELMLRRIEAVIQRHDGKRILCIAGCEHNHVFYQRLKNRHDPLIYPLAIERETK